MAKDKERNKARALRRQGWRIKDIAKEVGIRSDTVSKWCRDIELTSDQIAAIAAEDPGWLARHDAAQQTKKEALEQRITYQKAGRERAREGSDLHLLGCMLYWGEGAKGRNHLKFVNTDPHMLKLYMRFLREEFQIQDKDIYLNVMHHTKNEDEIVEIRNYWLNWLNLSLECNVNMQLKKGSDSRKSRYEYGICSIDVSRTELLHHVYGAIQEYIGFVNPDWLK